MLTLRYPNCVRRKIVAFRKLEVELARPTAAVLTARMAGIGMQFATARSKHAPIEETLVLASEEGMMSYDLRVLSILVTWLEVHHAYVNADRLIRLVRSHKSKRVRAFWAAVSWWLSSDRRLLRLRTFYDAQRIDVLKTGTGFQIKRHGEDERFAGSSIRVPANALRSRSSDVLSSAALAAVHGTYRHRVLMGPTWRADAWSELAADPSMSTAELARRAGCAFATAWHVKRDFVVLGGLDAALVLS